MHWSSWTALKPVRTPIAPGSWPPFIGAGWQALLDDLHRELVYLDPACFVFEAGAAAHGALTVQMHAPQAVTNEARELVAHTVAKSRVTCERCGAPGRLYGGTWLVTLCASCAPR